MLSRNGGHWKGLDDLEIETCAWVSWFNEERLHSELGDVTPAEFEEDYRHRSQARWPEGSKQKSLRQSQSDSNYSAQMESAEEWTVKRQLAGKPKAVVDQYERFVRLLTACGPYTVSVTKTAIAFTGTHRGFAGAKPRKDSLDGFLDLQREVQDERFLRVSPYTKSLYVHQFRIVSAAQLDDSFAVLIEEAYQVGCGAHRPSRKSG